jgi:hypothetical protein
VADFVYKISDKAFSLLKQMEAVVVYDENLDKGEVDPPEDVIKELKPALITKFNDKIKELGLTAEASPDNYFLVLARNEGKSKEPVYVGNQDALLVESIEVGRSEVNGVSDKYTLYLVVQF